MYIYIYMYIYKPGLDLTSREYLNLNLIANPLKQFILLYVIFDNCTQYEKRELDKI